MQQQRPSSPPGAAGAGAQSGAGVGPSYGPSGFAELSMFPIPEEASLFEDGAAGQRSSQSRSQAGPSRRRTPSMQPPPMSAGSSSSGSVALPMWGSVAASPQERARGGPQQQQQQQQQQPQQGGEWELQAGLAGGDGPAVAAAKTRLSSLMDLPGAADVVSTGLVAREDLERRHRAMQAAALVEQANARKQEWQAKSTVSSSQSSRRA